MIQCVVTDSQNGALSEEPLSPETPKRPKFKRLHQETCGRGRQEYDGYEDVREACERKLAEWEREGVLAPQVSFKGNDWLFG